MNIFFLYLVKATACSAVLYLYYFLFLRNRPIHKYNRYFLLITIACGLVLPIVSIPVTLPASVKAEVLYFKSLTAITVVNSSAGTGTVWQHLESYLLVAYLLVVLVLLTRLISSIVKIASLKRKYPVLYYKEARLYFTDEKNAPFSFLDNIFWNNAIEMKSKKGEQILRHELYHVKERHTLDLLLIHFVSAIAWINPFNYLIRKELLAVHEYMADEFAAGNGSRQEYAILLVDNAIAYKQSDRPIHSFFHSQIQKRIAMILQQSSSTSTFRISRIMILPLVVILFSSLAFKIKLPAENGNSTHGVTVTDTVTEPVYKGGAAAWMSLMINNLKYPQEAQSKKKEGKVVIEFTVDVDGTVAETRITEDPGYGLGEEALRIVKLSSGNWIPATKNGMPVQAKKSQPVLFQLNSK